MTNLPRRSPLLFLAAWLVSVPAGAELIDRIVATVDGEPITLSDLERYASERTPQLATIGGSASREEMLEALITERLVTREIETKGIRVGDAEIDAYIERIQVMNRIDQMQMQEAIRQQNLTWEQYRDQVRGEIQKMQLLNREIRGRVNITDEDVERYYEKHKTEWELPAVVRLRHIVLRLDENAPDAAVELVEERIRDVRRRIADDGEDFEEVAREVSEDGAASEGGDLGEVKPGSVLPEFETAMEELEEGEVSEPIRTAAGFHLLRIDERVDTSHTSLEELADSIREKLYAEKLDTRYRRWLLEDLKERHHVEIQL